MNISGIGVQQILPQSGTPWQGSNPAEASAGNNSGGGEDASAVQPVERPAPPPPPPGTGTIVDRTV